LGGSGFSVAGLTVGSEEDSAVLCCSPETRTFFSLSAMLFKGMWLRERNCWKEKGPDGPVKVFG
jgi:hypothetical protein